MEKMEPFCSWRQCKLIQPLWRTVCRFLKKIGIKLPYDPAIPLLDIYPEKNHSSKRHMYPNIHSVQFSSVTQSCLPLCNPMDCSTPGFPVLYHFPDLLKLMSIESLIPSNHPILCCPLLPRPQSFPA